MKAKTLAVQVGSRTTLDAVPVLVDVILTLEFPVEMRVAQASLSEMIASSTLAALLHGDDETRARLRTSIERRAGRHRTPVLDARIVRVSVPPHLQAYNDACLLAALADVRQRYSAARRQPLPFRPDPLVQ